MLFLPIAIFGLPPRLWLWYQLVLLLIPQGRILTRALWDYPAFGRPSGAYLLANERVVLAGQFAHVLLADGSVDALVEAASRERLRPQALEYLQEIAAGRSRAFAKHVHDPDRQLRTDMIDVLGLSADPAALPLLEALTSDTDSVVAHAAARAVARLQVASAS